MINFCKIFETKETQVLVVKGDCPETDEPCIFFTCHSKVTEISQTYRFNTSEVRDEEFDKLGQGFCDEYVEALKRNTGFFKD